MLIISPINFNIIKNQTRKKKNHLTDSSKNLNYPQNLSFKSNKLHTLEKEYISLIKDTKTSPIQAFLSLTAESSLLKSLFTNIMKNEETAFEFISEAIKEPRKSTEIAKKISEKIGNGTNIFYTFSYGSDYNNAYEKFINKKFNEAKTIEELLAIRPDWNEKKLLEKSINLKKQEFELGIVPLDLPKDDLIKIVDYLKNYIQDFGAKQATQIPEINISGKIYKFEYFTDGKTDKNVFGINLPNGKRYIIKMANENRKSLEKDFALGTLAKIDTYMTLNKSRNSAPLLYYNHNKNFLIYEYIEHTPANGDTKNLSEILKHIPDYKELGLQFNDSIGSNNCFLLNKNSNNSLMNTYKFSEGVKAEEWISIDNDHVTYNNILNPQIRSLHSYLPNAMQYCV